MNLEEAINKIKQTLEEDPNYDSEYQISESEIIETDYALHTLGLEAPDGIHWQAH